MGAGMTAILVLGFSFVLILVGYKVGKSRGYETGYRDGLGLQRDVDPRKGLRVVR